MTTTSSTYDEYPLTTDQQFYYEHFRAERETIAVLNMDCVQKLTGPLDVDAFVQAFREVIRRQDTLHTIAVPPTKGREAFLRVLPADALSVEVFNFAAFSKAEALERARRTAADFAWKRFDMDKDLLCRLFLIILPNDTYVAGIVCHHFLADFIALSIIWNDLVEAYRRIRAKAPPAPPLKARYWDFLRERVAWDRDWRSSKTAAYWHRQMEILQPYPNDASAPVATSTDSLPTMAFSASEKAALMQLARQEKATLFMVLLALFAGALCKYSSQKKVFIGVMTDQRTREEYLNVAGFFTNVVTVSMDGSDDPSFRALLQRARRAGFDVMENPWAPADLSAHIYKNRISLHMLDYVDLTKFTSDFEGITVERFQFDPPPARGQTANNFLFANMVDSITGAAICRFPEFWDQNAAVLNSMKTLALEALKDPDAKVSALWG